VTYAIHAVVAQATARAAGVKEMFLFMTSFPIKSYERRSPRDEHNRAKWKTCQKNRCITKCILKFAKHFCYIKSKSELGNTFYMFVILSKCHKQIDYSV